MNTLHPTARRRIPRPLGIGLLAGLILAVAGLIYASYGAGEVASQGSRPGVPTSVTLAGTQGKNAKGDQEMRIVWTAPAAGSCAATEYFLRIYDADHSIPEQGHTPYTEYVVTKLTASTTYSIEVWAYGASCDNYSTTPGTHSNTTNSANSSNDPAPAANQPMMAGNSPGSVSVSKSGATATLSWSAPAADSDRCPHTEYTWRVNNWTPTDDTMHQDGDYLTGTTATVTGLTTGKTYIAQVWSYSERPCDLYSPVSWMEWTH